MPLFINHNVSHTQCEVYMYVYIAEAREWICSDNLPCTEPLPAARRTSSFHVCSPLCDDNCRQCYICQNVVGVLSARVLGNDSEPSSHQLGGLGSAVSSPVVSGATSWASRAFGVFYCSGNT